MAASAQNSVAQADWGKAEDKDFELREEAKRRYQRAPFRCCEAGDLLEQQRVTVVADSQLRGCLRSGATKRPPTELSSSVWWVVVDRCDPVSTGPTSLFRLAGVHQARLPGLRDPLSTKGHPVRLEKNSGLRLLRLLDRDLQGIQYTRNSVLQDRSLQHGSPLPRHRPPRCTIKKSKKQHIWS